MSQHPPDDLDDLEDDTHAIYSFIVRLWKEEDGVETRRQVWRGHLTSIPGNQRHYFASIDEIPALIASHLDGSG